MEKKVLVIEDDADIRKNIMEIVRGEGYGVEAASNGKEALDRLLTTTELPALIMLDLMMPVMDGFEFRRHQLEDHHLAQIPVAIMTADGQIEAKRERLGANAFLRKPIDLNDFLTLVEKYCS